MVFVAKCQKLMCIWTNNIFSYQTALSFWSTEHKGAACWDWKQCSFSDSSFFESLRLFFFSMASFFFYSIRSGGAFWSGARRLPHMVCIFCSMKRGWNVWTSKFFCIGHLSVMISGRWSPSAPSERITFDVGSLRSHMQISSSLEEDFMLHIWTIQDVLLQRHWRR